MSPAVALQVLIDCRQEDWIVVTNQGSSRIWPQLARHPLDFHFNPSTMGGAIPLALGLALAQPRRHVLCVSGDGSLLMSLGSLVTVVGCGATNLTVVVLENGTYEITGGQQIPAAGNKVDIPVLALATGFPNVRSFCDLAEWRTGVYGFLSLSGPRFASLKVGPASREQLAFPTPPIGQQLAELRRALGTDFPTKVKP